MSKYTPGKWVARNDPNGSPADACIGLEDDTSPIDYVAVCHTRDAPLIAAAPELLHACELIAQNAPLVATWLAANDPAAFAQVNAAIAKATGGDA